MIFDYVDGLVEALEFLRAIGSIAGFLGLIFGIIGMFAFGDRARRGSLGIIVVSIVLLTICGLDTGFRYFNIY
jgi:hypothetical protein